MPGCGPPSLGQARAYRSSGVLSGFGVDVFVGEGLRFHGLGFRGLGFRV